MRDMTGRLPFTTASSPLRAAPAPAVAFRRGQMTRSSASRRPTVHPWAGALPHRAAGCHRRPAASGRRRVWRHHPAAPALRLVRCCRRALWRLDQRVHWPGRNQTGRSGWFWDHPALHGLPSGLRGAYPGARHRGAGRGGAHLRILAWLGGLHRRCEGMGPVARQHAYLRRIEELAGVPIRYVSVGPRREQMICL